MANFKTQPDKEKAKFLEIANRGEGLSPLDYIYAEEGSFDNLKVNEIDAGSIDLYDLITTRATIEDTLTAKYINVEDIDNILLKVTQKAIIKKIESEKIKSDLIITDELRIKNNDKTMTFKYDGDSDCTYVWPAPPLFIVPIPTYTIDYLAYNGNDNISFKQDIISPTGDINIGPYLTIDESALSWKNTYIPSIPGTYTVGPYLSLEQNDFIWKKALVIITLPGSMLNDYDTNIKINDSITIDDKNFVIPKYKNV